MKLRERLNSIKKYFNGGKIVPFTTAFDHSAWSKELLESYKSNLNMADMFNPPKPEAVCPITKALIVQQLSDLGVKYPKLSIREIISIAMQDGVRDDYELAEKLKAIETHGVKQNVTATEIKFRSQHAIGRMNDLQDSMSYAMRGLVDNVRMAAKSKPVQLAGSSDPADTTGSSGG